QDENPQILCLVINRLSYPIKNLAFDYTLGTQDGEYVFDELHVTMDEETAGVLQPNSTFPLVLPITPEQDEVLQTINEDNQLVKVENFECDKEEKYHHLKTALYNITLVIRLFFLFFTVFYIIGQNTDHF